MDLLQGFCLFAATNGVPSFAAIASFISLLNNSTISKQAIHQRTTTALVLFFKNVLMHLLCQATACIAQSQTTLFASFNRVLLEDSSSIALPAALAKFYPGSRNQTGKPFSVLKVHAFFDLRAGSYCSFSLNPFTANDQSLAFQCLKLLKPGDLIIRDLGFFVFKAIKQLIEDRIFFLSRLRYGTTLFCADGKRKLNLLKLLRKNGRCDINVLLGEQEKIPVRLVAVALPEHIAAKRRHELRRNRDRRCVPSKEHLALCGWSIFVTNIPREVWSADNVAKLYALRWRVETIFKTWKSHCHFRSLPQKASLWQVEATIYARLIFITLFQQSQGQLIYAQASNNLLSLQKLTWFITTFFWQFMQLSMYDPDRAKEMLLYHCKYDKRKRWNFVQNAMNLELIKKSRKLS